MSNARNLSNLLEAGGDVKLSSLDNAPAPSKSTIDALGIAATSVTGSQATAITANSAKVGITSAQASEITANNAKVTNSDQSKADIEALGIAASSITGALPSISGAALTNLPGGSTTYGAVGTYGLFSSTVLTSRAPSTTLAGSGLYPASTYTNSGQTSYYSGSGHPAGTWRLMGQTGYYNGTTPYIRMDMTTSIWARIA